MPTGSHIFRGDTRRLYLYMMFLRLGFSFCRHAKAHLDTDCHFADFDVFARDSKFYGGGTVWYGGTIPYGVWYGMVVVGVQFGC